jgi:lipoprotein-releasing system ATP-binding protein
MLIAKDIKKGYPEGDGRRLEVLGGADLSVSDGEFVAITGESGVGKSTLLHLLGLLDTPDDGEIYIDGKPVSNESDRNRAAIRMRKIGFVFQFHHLLPEFNAIENIAIPLRLADFSESKAMERAGQLLEEVGLSERADHFPNALSGGEQQRIALARALACQPRLLLADEPTGNLDEKTASKLTDLLFRMTGATGMSVVLATHNRELAAQADSIYLLESGVLKVVEQKKT